jgi:catechol 2,3-dioxygenase-like lactoylglutathione lyase family enzyme
MAKIRHIAYRAQDTEAMTTFFVDAFEMEVIQRRGNGAIDLSDGTLNITILPMNRPTPDGAPPKPGIEHMGFTVEDDDAAKARLLALGAKELNRINFGNDVHFEVKFEGPEGIVVDIGHWAGTAPIDEPVAEPAAAR